MILLIVQMRTQSLWEDRCLYEAAELGTVGRTKALLATERGALPAHPRVPVAPVYPISHGVLPDPGPGRTQGWAQGRDEGYPWCQPAPFTPGSALTTLQPSLWVPRCFPCYPETPPSATWERTRLLQCRDKSKQARGAAGTGPTFLAAKRCGASFIQHPLREASFLGLFGPGPVCREVLTQEGKAVG